MSIETTAVHDASWSFKRAPFIWETRPVSLPNEKLLHALDVVKRAQENLPENKTKRKMVKDRLKVLKAEVKRRKEIGKL